MNFFKGLFTTAEDWQSEQHYHIGKRKLHNRCLHTPGVVAGEGDELRVVPSETGNIIVQPGYAVDRHGHDLYLAEPKEFSIRPEANATENEMEVFVFISFAEQKADPRNNHLSPDLSDHAFVLESPVVGWTKQAPDNREKIELARFKWQVGRRITSDQIDTGHVRYAGAAQPASLIKSDYVGLNPSPPDKGMQFDLGDTRVIVQSFKDISLALGAIYTANVIPVEVTGAIAQDPRIIWRIESSINAANEVAYFLVLKNIGTVKVKAKYEIYRLNVHGHR